MTRPSDERLRQVFNLVERHVEQRYQLPVIIADVKDPFTGDLNGAEILVDYDLSVDHAVFILVHLFGHTAQWCSSERARKIGFLFPSAPDEALLAELEAYEREACEISLSLFHEVGVLDLDQWLSDFAACDFAYLRHFYRTGEKAPFESFWRDAQPLLVPRPIPSFVPTRWLSRYDGVVV